MEAPPLVQEQGAPRPRVTPRLVALDLDGTCLDAGQTLHPRTRAAVREAAQQLPVVIATGRMYTSTTPWARALGLTAPVVCYQGAMVRELPGAEEEARPGRILLADGLAAGPALAALRLSRDNGWHFQAYRADRLICERDRPEARLYARIAQTGINFVDDLEPLLRDGTVKALCVIEDAAEASRCEAMLRAELSSSARVVRSLPPFVEITSPTAGKARAVARLCELLGIDAAEVVAVGDAPNDTDLLAMAGFAVAVDGSPAELLAVADVRCSGPERAGVAEVLRLLGLTGDQSRGGEDTTGGSRVV
ncbi:MAG: HAD hydrolase family protein [Candidatus Dormibacteria bacterium]